MRDVSHIGRGKRTQQRGTLVNTRESGLCRPRISPWCSEVIDGTLCKHLSRGIWTLTTICRNKMVREVGKSSSLGLESASFWNWGKRHEDESHTVITVVCGISTHIFLGWIERHSCIHYVVSYPRHLGVELSLISDSSGSFDTFQKLQVQNWNDQTPRNKQNNPEVSF